MKVFSVSLNANVEASVRGGNFFMLIDTTAPLDVSLVRGGVIQEKAESVEAGFKATGRAENESNGARYFDEARLISATTQTVKVGVSDGSGGYDRALGEVTSEPKLTQSAAAPVGIDALVTNGVCFAGNVARAAVAAEYPHVQLFNPAASGKTLYIDGLVMSKGTSGAIYVGRYDTALITLSGNGVNQEFGGAASVAELRSASLAAITIGDQIQSLYCGASVPYELVVIAPFIVPPGFGMLLTVSVVNQDLYASFRWREYA